MPKSLTTPLIVMMPSKMIMMATMAMMLSDLITHSLGNFVFEVVVLDI